MKISLPLGLAFAVGLYFASVEFSAAQELPATTQKENSAQTPAHAADAAPARETTPANISNVAPPALELGPPAGSAGSPPLPALPNGAPFIAPPPRAETAIQQSQAAGNDSFTPGVPNLKDLAMALPEVEVWRAQSLSPQIPDRRHRRFDLAYVVGKEPALVRLRFHPLAAGQGVIIQPGPGVTVDPPDTEFRVEKNGECVVSVALDGNFIRSDFNIYCAGVKTKVPLERATVETVQAREAAGRSGR